VNTDNVEHLGYLLLLKNKLFKCIECLNRCKNSLLYLILFKFCRSEHVWLPNIP